MYLCEKWLTMYVHVSTCMCINVYMRVCVDLTVHCIESEELEVEIPSTFTLQGAPEGSENKIGIIKFNNVIEFILQLLWLLMVHILYWVPLLHYFLHCIEYRVIIL